MSYPSEQDEKSQKTSNAMKVSEKGGLFDSDDEENLFVTVVKRPISFTKNVEKIQTKTESSRPEDNRKTQEKDLLNSESSSLSWQNNNSKSTTGLFSDDDDDLFGIPTTKNESSISVHGSGSPVIKEKPPRMCPLPSESEESQASRPAFVSTFQPEYSTPSRPIGISELPKNSHSLFSSPSDDDLFSSIPQPIQKTNPSSAIMRDPPPLPTQSSVIEAGSFKEDPTQPDMFLYSSNNEPIKANLEENPKETSSSLFSSPSDEEDFFSPVHPIKNSTVVPFSPSKELEPSVEPQLIKNPIPKETTIKTKYLKKEATEESSFPDMSPNIYSNQNACATVSDKSYKRPYLGSEKNKDIVVDNKEDIFYSTEEELFGVTERLLEPSSSSLKERDSSSPLIPDVQLQDNSEILSIPSEDAATSVLPESPKDDPSILNERTPYPQNVVPIHREPNASGTEKQKDGAEPPASSVTLSTGKELDAEISKQTTQNINKQKIDDIFGDESNFEKEHDYQYKGLIFDKNHDGKFASSGNLRSHHTGTLLQRQSPPLLPEEIQNHSKAENDFSIKQKSPTVQEKNSQRILIKSDDQLDKHSDIISDQQKLKLDKSENDEERKEKKEISSSRKPPVGGIFVFGDSATKNSELFAKVLQRKSMLACESDSSEEDAPTDSADTTPSILPTGKGTTLSKPVMSPAAVFPHSTYSPVFSLDHPESKPGEDEDGVSFQDPATLSNVLQSLNKVRFYMFSISCMPV